MNNPKPITLYDHEIRRLLTGAPVLIVRPMKKQPPEGWGGTSNLIALDSPFVPGQSMWVRETWTPTQFGKPVYRADCRDKDGCLWPSVVADPDGVKWRSPVTMPRRASRLSIVTETVAVKQVQDVTEDEAAMVGCGKHGGWNVTETKYGVNYSGEFSHIFDSHFPDHPYSANPHCWLATVRQSDG
jgi:hypothetical protein